MKCYHISRVHVFNNPYFIVYHREMMVLMVTKVVMEIKVQSEVWAQLVLQVCLDPLVSLDSPKDQK